LCILAVGKVLAAAERAADALAAEGVRATVWDVRSCAPLDEDMLDDAFLHRVVITAEDGIREGGVGMSIADLLSARGTPGSARPYVEVLGVPTEFVPQAKPDVILRQVGLDAEGIASTARRLLVR
jgi:1-deoxy-D-xylulose-5-phosphate synthase